MVKIAIGHLYPNQMNVYGDMGNVITLRYRLEARGFQVQYEPLTSAKDIISARPDIIIGGGGQDSNQDVVQKDLLAHKTLLKNQAEAGTVMLMICGLYQLFGHKFVVSDQHVIDGVGILDIETKAGSDRLIGNIITESAWGQLVGFENHSGRTTLGSQVEPLGRVIKGGGNNGESDDEGAVYKNVFGSYLHGPMLVKNPQFADELIRRVLENKGIPTELIELDDSFELEAARRASKRPR